MNILSQSLDQAVVVPSGLCSFIPVRFVLICLNSNFGDLEIPVHNCVILMLSGTYSRTRIDEFPGATKPLIGHGTLI